MSNSSQTSLDVVPQSVYNSQTYLNTALGQNTSPQFNWQISYSLLQGACSSEGSGDNCTSACTNPANAFGSSATLTNCLFLPLVSSSIALESVSASNLIIAESFGILPNDTNASSDVMHTVADCVTEYCDKNGICQSSSNTSSGSETCMPEQLYTSNHTAFLLESWNCISVLCHNSQVTVDPDIGGIGVYISYLMQLGISVIGAVMLACLDIVCKMKEVPRWLRNLPGWEQMMKKNNHHSKKIRNWSEKNLKRIHEHHLPALVAGLVEFHKAQCLFTITIQIAAIIVWNQLLIQILAINGLVPVSCTILSLWVYGKRSWYLLLLSIVSFVISTTAYFVAAYHSFYAIETTYTPYSKCGNIDPTGLCGIAFVGVIADIGAGAYTFICVLGLMIVILTLHKLSSSYPSVSDPLKKRFKSQSKVYQNLIAVWNSMIGVYIIRYIIFFGAVMFSIQIYSFETLEALGLIDTTNWSFGQIVGIAVWAPPIFEYLKTWIQGIEKGSGYRLAHGYQVSKIPVAGQITRTPSQHGSELPTIVPTNPRDPSSSPSPLPSSHPQGEHEHGSVVQPKQSGAGSAVPLSTESTVLLHDQEIMQTAMPLQALTPSQSPSRQSSLDGRTQGFKPIPHSMTA